MEILKYPESKALGNVSLKRYGETCQCIIRQFSPDTGAEIAPIVATLDHAQLQIERTRLVAQLAAMDALLADMDALTGGKG